MSGPERIAAFDRDGALRETWTRAQLLRGAAGAAAVALGGLSAGGSPAAASVVDDVAILNYALALEELQAAFYSDAERAGALGGALARQAQVVGAHERAHVVALRGVLGSRAIARPAFDFGGVTEEPERFRRTAVAFEDLAVAAYKDQLPGLRRREHLAAALAIHSVEARHAAWIRRLAGALPAADAFDEPLPRDQVHEIVDATGFATRRARTEGGGRPRFTG